MKTIDELALEVAKHTVPLTMDSRDVMLVKFGIIAGLRLAAEVCETMENDAYLKASVALVSGCEEESWEQRDTQLEQARAKNAILTLIPTPAESAERGDTNENE